MLYDDSEEMNELVEMRQDLLTQLKQVSDRSPQTLATGAKKSILEKAISMLNEEITALAQLDRLSR